ncbi:Trehalose/maltose import ATP-binding protein MalK [Metallosphaera sp. J1]|uniref:ABC transporter ATP-binding protein n=1 Tax=Metallosphaera TaxID=41980 RepID=UPI001EE0C55D|nr:ABC transporter ATP-binding protein [Metallosphaera javensis (ex Hofmann et al. 2022)]MCG3109091.1 Trehalose/maltose import ATP-binding protein MalK [Metallosphaera javensis (ex Hofmann et al. 2022)]BCS93629.1 MAG: MarR family transcriptional regulator [Metallosphaera javensis (ex Sakai et al. 2022)]
MSQIEARDIWKSYGKNVANQGVSFTINEGEFVTFLGPNGGGKTTLMRQIYGELYPDRGELRIMGEKPQRALKFMGVVPQEGRPLDSLTAEEHVTLLGKLKNLSREEARARGRELLQSMGIDPRARVDNLSGGNKRKVLIISAIISNPRVLILDEPTVGLDPEARRDVWNYLLEMKKDGKTIILTTHYLEEAETLSDRIYFLNKKILLEGKVSEIKQRFSEYYEVTNVDTGEKHYVKREELKEFLGRADFRFEVRLPSLEEIYMRLFQ